jgi:hypothetical protein
VIDYSNRRSWDDLVFGSYSLKEVQAAVVWTSWQLLRAALLGRPLDERYTRLRSFLVEQDNSRQAQIVITNYVHALSRGGLIK